MIQRELHCWHSSTIRQNDMSHQDTSRGTFSIYGGNSCSARKEEDWAIKIEQHVHNQRAQATVTPPHRKQHHDPNKNYNVGGRQQCAKWNTFLKQIRQLGSLSNAIMLNPPAKHKPCVYPRCGTSNTHKQQKTYDDSYIIETTKQ
jgi:hypothetical protein